MAKKKPGRPRKNDPKIKDWDAFERKSIEQNKRIPSLENRNRRELFLPESELKKITISKRWKTRDIKQAYVDFYNGKYNYAFLCTKLKISRATLKKYFAKITYLMQVEEERREFLRWKAEKSNNFMKTQLNTEKNEE